MTKSQLEKKINHLKKEIMYVSRVFPKSDKISLLKIEYKYYKKIAKLR